MSPAKFFACLVSIAYIFAEPAVSACAQPAKNESGQSPIEQIRGEVARLVRDLDADQYTVRAAATARLADLVARPELGPLLAEEFQRVLVRPDTSFEVRKGLEALRRDLPETPAERTGEASAEEIEGLVLQLEDESYGARVAATVRLRWLMANPKLACPIMLRLKRRLAGDHLSPDGVRWTEPIYEEARASWLMSDPQFWELPPVSDEQIERWVDDLVRDESLPAENVIVEAGWSARRELCDLLAREEYLAKVKRVLENRLAQDELGAGPKARLQELVGLTRPAMVAEYWERSKCTNQQHLLVDVPSLGHGATRPSHFDRIDDEVAHCVSGQNLSPGDYPVGVAFPHPNRRGALFRLVNLPTPRHRIAYEYHLKTDETKRLRELSRRTLDSWLDRRGALTEGELAILLQLDAAEVSRFAGKIFHTVEDQQPRADSAVYPYPDHPTTSSSHLPVAGQAGHHAMICALLAARGNREAIPGLLEAIRKGRFAPSKPRSPLKFPWVAALTIAVRDPWPEVDTWLAGLVERPELLVEGQFDAAPELGATAAALLLERHQEPPARFGLQPAGQQWLARFKIAGYRFAEGSSPQEVKNWWQDKTDGDVNAEANVQQ
jgi:hypothetical protein